MSTVEQQVDTALNLIIITQVALADPEFWDEYGDIIAEIEEFTDPADRMRFDLNVWLPKVEELRKLGLISDVETTRAAAIDLVASLQSEQDLFALAQKVGKEMMPK